MDVCWPKRGAGGGGVFLLNWSSQQPEAGREDVPGWLQPLEWDQGERAAGG